MSATDFFMAESGPPSSMPTFLEGSLQLAPGPAAWSTPGWGTAKSVDQALSTPSMRPLKNRRWAKANAMMPGVTTIT